MQGEEEGKADRGNRRVATEEGVEWGEPRQMFPESGHQHSILQQVSKTKAEKWQLELATCSSLETLVRVVSVEWWRQKSW